MKRIILFLFATMSLLLAACNTDEPNTGVQTCIVDDIEYSYYLTDTEGVIKNSFSKGEIVRVHLDLRNKGLNILMAFVNDIGDCYDSKGNLQEILSANANTDTVPVFRMINPGDIVYFKQSYKLSVSSGLYHYQKPYVMYYVKGSEDTKDIKHKSIPLTLDFKIK